MTAAAEGGAGSAGTGGVLAAGHAGHVFLLDAGTGRVLWERPLAAVSGAGACEGRKVSALLSGDVVHAGCMGHIFAFAAADGALLWHTDCRRRGEGETCLAASSPAPACTEVSGSG